MAEYADVEDSAGCRKELGFVHRFIPDLFYLFPFLWYCAAVISGNAYVLSMLHLMPLEIGADAKNKY